MPGVWGVIALSLYGAGWFTLAVINRAGRGSSTFHVIDVNSAIAIHAAILLHVRRKLLALQRKPGKGPA